ncbi:MULTISPECIES: ShlB/FhaC/HecB family hemolysin secretion/activation protein [unclassified Beijerinckia]|uniref:ShlB/FhaC/HecB family hemolysin secretion/activation protein n=1 Tax=unclassified Beijerinckia TaxID=2638183 RepID=UPI001FCD2E82|nr:MULTISPECIES: ShlB/FhaC/HecB family hemolysin secretion/activation protein [unclassified Beijerinckia]
MATPQAFAQTLPFNIGDAVRQSEATRNAAPQPRVGTPILPMLVEPPFVLKDKERLFVRRFKLEGPQLVNEAQTQALLAPYEGRKLTIAEIYEAADKITTLYRTEGYLVAKAYVPAQNATSGTLQIKIVPGKYGAVTLKNESLVRDQYMQSVLDSALKNETYIHKDRLERAMLLMSDLAGAGVPRIAIGPGKAPETSDFVFGVPEGRRVDGYLLGDNYGSPYTGRNRLSAGFNLNSPFGFGDRLSAYGILSENAKLKNGRVAYSMPLGSDGLRAEISAFRTTYKLGGIYQNLDATGTANGIAGTLTYAIKRQRDESIYVSANYTHKSLNDNILGLSLSHRVIDEGIIAVTREAQDSLLGLPWFTNATLSLTVGRVNFPDPAQLATNRLGVDTAGGFSKLNLQATSTLALLENLSLNTTVRAQRSLSGNLDSSEQFGLTGFWGVRSFDEGLAGDHGYLITPELKYALPGFNGYSHALGLFTDVGAVWIANPSYTTTQRAYTRLNDVGIGYYATYEYSPGRQLLLKAQAAHSYGGSGGALSYDKRTKVLLQVGFTF